VSSSFLLQISLEARVAICKIEYLTLTMMHFEIRRHVYIADKIDATFCVSASVSLQACYCTDFFLGSSFSSHVFFNYLVKCEQLYMKMSLE